MAAIVAENLTKRFGNFTAVDQLNLTIEEGTIFGFLGPNGSGKSTVIRMLCGLLRPSAGTAKVLNHDIVRAAESIKNSVGYMSQQFSLYTDLTVLENLNFYSRIYGLSWRERKSRIEEVMSIVGIGPYRTHLGQHLSGGWKQRLALACALVHRPKLVFLDEPTAGIDPVARRELWNLLFDLSAQGVTFFVTTHYMDEAERCTHVGYIYFSKLVVCGTPEEIKRMPTVTPRDTVRFELHCPRLSAAMRYLAALDYVRDTTIFGNSLHVLIESRGVDRLTDDLRKAGFGHVGITPIDPSLEDVFVTLTRYSDN